MTRQAAILVGGPSTACPALTPIDDATVFLDYLVGDMAREGFRDILLCAGPAADEVIARYDRRRARDASLRVLVGESPFRALAAARDELDDTIAVADGEHYLDVNWRSLDRLLAQDDGAQIAAAGPMGICRRGSLAQAAPDTQSSAHLISQQADSARLLRQACAGYAVDLGRPGAAARARVELPVVARRPVLLLDRDGVLNEDEGYTHRVEDLRWMAGAIEVVRRANDLGALVVVVTNQAGVARGLYELEAVDRFHAAMQDDLARAGAHIDAFYVSPYHPEALIDRWRHPSHPDRKPNPGMIRRAFADWSIDVASSVMIGDKASDVEAAEAAGVTGLLFAGTDLREIALPALDAMAAARARNLDLARSQADVAAAHAGTTTAE